MTEELSLSLSLSLAPSHSPCLIGRLGDRVLLVWVTDAAGLVGVLSRTPGMVTLLLRVMQRPPSLLLVVQMLPMMRRWCGW